MTLPVQGAEPWDAALAAHLAIGHRADGSHLPIYSLHEQTGAVGDETDETQEFSDFIDLLNATENAVGIIDPPQSFYLVTSALPALTAASPSLIGHSARTTIIKYTGSGSCLTVYQDPYDNAATPPHPQSTGARLGGFTIDGGSAVAGAVGLDYGDVVGGVLYDIAIQNFDKAASVGLWLHNRAYWTERLLAMALRLNANNTSLRVAKEVAAHASYEFNTILDLQCSINSYQTGVRFETGIVWNNGYFNGSFNMGALGTCCINVDDNASFNDNIVKFAVDSASTNPCIIVDDAGGALWRSMGIIAKGGQGGHNPLPITGTIHGANLISQHTSATWTETA